MKITYVQKTFRQDSLDRIEQANEIIEEYAEQGFDLTVRQLYYQFVARDLIPNRQSEYKRLCDLVNAARLAGLIDWDVIQDRTRNVRANAHWNSPHEIVQACASQYRIDLWEDQPFRCEVWIEKDALVGVIEGVCQELDVAYFSCRGYTSQSEMWRAAERVRSYAQDVTIIHLGDHDPSGIDMTRDIQDRLDVFGADATVRRIALTIDQVSAYKPPPNPAKVTDSRYASYVACYGKKSWELDALEPAVLEGLIREAVADLRDSDLWNESLETQSEARKKLQSVARHWDKVCRCVSKG